LTSDIRAENALASVRLQELLKQVARCSKYGLKRELLSSASEVSFTLPDAICENTTCTLSKNSDGTGWALRIVSGDDVFRYHVSAALPWLQGHFYSQGLGYVDVSIAAPADE